MAIQPLPKNLPVPQDDGAAAHLAGLELPAISLPATDGSSVRLDQLSSGRSILFVYPKTGRPGVAMPAGWDDIPGARGCTQEVCSFRDLLSDLIAAGAEQVLALSADSTENQRELVERVHLRYLMLSDPDLLVAKALGLPTFTAAGMTLYKRLTMVVLGKKIEHVFYPIFPPDKHAEEVLDWLKTH